ncbi:MAG: DUF58 domain-containing protein [Candidatus Riflebacteria bacterium]|nr:DUF58 domain-containing protein [Candidatus Riflebacteria bacterium]
MKAVLDPVAVSRLQNHKLRARLVVEGFLAGSHRSPYKGHSTDFADFRKYTRGDDPRHIDWRMFAKADRHYIREYEDQTSMSVWLAVDTSESMGYRSGAVSKLEYASYLAASLAYLVMKQQDNAGLVTFGDRLRRFFPPRRGPAHLNLLLEELEELRPEGLTRCAAALDEIGGRLRKRGLVVLLSDLLDEPRAVLASLKVLRGMKNEVIVFHVLDRDEIEFPFAQRMDFEDVETGQRLELDCEVIRREYQERVRRFTGFFGDECPRADIDYVTANTSQPFHELLSRFLLKRSEVRR